MAKKKNQSKKHKFKYSEPTSEMTTRSAEAAAPVAAAAGAAATTNGSTGKPRAEAVVAATTRDFSYVLTDLKRISLLLGSLVVLELVLWYLFHHTGVGDSIRSVIKV